MTQAKDLATFIIEPVGSSIMDPDTYLVRKRYQDTETVESYANNAFSTALFDINAEFCSSASSVGCRIYLKNGLYEMDQSAATDGGLVVFGTTDEGGHVDVYLEGETRDGVIIRNIETTPEETPTSQMIRAKCSLHCSNFTLDGNANNITPASNLNGIKGYGQTNGTPVLEAYNCRFMWMDSTNFCTGSNWATFIMDNCIVEKPGEDAGDQVNFAIASDREGFIKVTNNYFDRTNGDALQGSGATITSGGSHDVIVANNIIKREEIAAGTQSTAISLETYWDYPFNQVQVSNNLIHYGEIRVGQSTLVPDPDQPATNVFITGNTIYKGGIHVEGPQNDPTYVRDIFVEDNKLVDPWETGIYVKNTSGLVSVRRNTIKNSNISGSTFNGQQTLIFLNTCTDVFCEDNFLYMGVVSPPDADVSAQGIRCSDIINSTIRDNRIINRTVANNSYQINGTNTGSLISKSL
jgi:hypothetical protein